MLDMLLLFELRTGDHEADAAVAHAALRHLVYEYRMYGTSNPILYMIAEAVAHATHHVYSSDCSGAANLRL